MMACDDDDFDGDDVDDDDVVDDDGLFYPSLELLGVDFELPNRPSDIQKRRFYQNWRLIFETSTCSIQRWFWKRCGAQFEFYPPWLEPDLGQKNLKQSLDRKCRCLKNRAPAKIKPSFLIVGGSVWELKIDPKKLQEEIKTSIIMHNMWLELKLSSNHGG